MVSVPDLWEIMCGTPTMFIYSLINPKWNPNKPNFQQNEPLKGKFTKHSINHKIYHLILVKIIVLNIRSQSSINTFGFFSLGKD